MAQTSSFSTFVRMAALCSIGLLLILILHAAALGQGSTPERGFQPGASYALGDIETINTSNGNLSLNLPLGKLAAGRGGFSGQLNLHYDSKLYDSKTEWYQDWDHLVFGEPHIVIRNMLVTSDQGGWHYGTGYELQLIDRMYQYPAEIAPQYPAQETIYHYKVKVAFPDGSVHEFFPRVGSTVDQGYSDIRPDGYQSRGIGGQVQDVPYFLNGVSYYTFDGTYIRLDVEHDSDSSPWNNPWTLTFPDGTKVTNLGSRITDRNGNYVEFSNITYNSHPATQLIDQLGRKIVIEHGGGSGGDLIHVPGVGGADLVYQVKWKTIQVWKTYSTAMPEHFSAASADGYPDQLGLQSVVSEIDLPAETGGLKYIFGYNAADYIGGPCCPPSYGWGELNSVTTPTGAQTQYQYYLDGQNGPGLGKLWREILGNSITQKTLTYQQQYDGNSTPVTETWTYNINVISGSGGILLPDGGAVTLSEYGHQNYRTQNPDGTMVEKIWQANRPQNFFSTSAYDEYTGTDPYDPNRVNAYVKTEYTSIKDAGGNYSKTAIKDYNYDKNGNVTRVAEYDWMDYASVSRGGPFSLPTTIPAGAVVKRVTTNTLARSTPDASDSSSNVADSYWNATAPNLRNAIAATEVSNGSATLSRIEFVHDNAGTTGNVTQMKSWDSTKGGYSNPLSGANSVSVSNQFDSYGNMTLSTDARGYQTQILYGAVGSFTDLYPTQIKAAYQTSVQRTENREYDFSTGLVTRTTDVDNNVSNSITYDIFGRPTLVKAAEGKPEEARTSSMYSDVDRRVIVKSDLNSVGDEKLVKIRHYDQLGRLRLVRRLEDATTQSATDETTGIKVQTRYQISGNFSYVLNSNPYRAATSGAAGGETTMGWSRKKSDTSGRVVEVQTFAGASAPAPWGTNTTSSGTVTTAYDANFSTVTDQAGKVRRGMTDSWGRLARVDEPDANGNLGLTSAPVQPTSYAYDALSNLITVIQGSQTRSFVYSSLARLTSATHPESGTINYQYDNNGNLIQKTDARNISITYTYDALNRNTSVNYSNTTIGSPDVPDISLFYDGATNGKGRFWYSYRAGNFSVGNNVEQTAIDSYDALGRPLVQRQLFKSNGSWGPTYQTSRNYNRAGSVISQTYPSGHVVSNAYDTAGRTNSITGNLGDGTTRNYASTFIYSAQNQITQELFGTETGLYHKLQYNARGQLWDVRVSTGADINGSWNRGCLQFFYDASYGYGTTGPDNNGNVLKTKHYIPLDEQSSTWATYDQVYAYDTLNRITSVAEYFTSSTQAQTQQSQQSYSYDRYGNRNIDAAQTWGTGINNKQFTIDAATNTFGVPGGQNGTMTYDASGNLITDTYTGAGAREYDAENKMTRAWGGNNQWQEYTYNGNGQRTRRKVDGQETWQIYGMDDELLAEYSANGSADTPQKEYGYRNGELLITASPGSGDQSLNLNGTSAYVQVPNSSSLNVSGAITVEAWIKVNAITGAFQDIISRESYAQSGTGGGFELSVSNIGKLRLDTYQNPTAYTPLVGNTTITTGAWHHVAGVFDGSQMRLYLDGVLDGTLSTSNAPASGTSSLKIGKASYGSLFGGMIDEARVSNSAVYTSNFTPQAHLTAGSSTKGLWKFDGTSTADSSGNGNNGSLQNSAAFSSDVPTGPTTSYYSGSFNGTGAHVQVPNSSSLDISGAITVEAWIKVNAITGAFQDVISRESYAQSGSGGGFELSVSNIGKLRLDTYQNPTTYTPLVGGTTITAGVWHHVAGVFDGSQMRLYLDGVLDGTLATSNAPASGTSSLKIGKASYGSYFGGLIDEARVSNTAVYTGNFTPPTHLTASSSTKGLWKFDGQTTNDSSGNANNGTLQSGATYSADVPSGDGGGSGSSSSTGAKIQWLISDQLGTPRMVIDQTGTLANIKRHDYLPFGEELFNRSASLGYTSGDGVRQQFTSKERDVETQLDYFLARYYSSSQGRFTSPDEFSGGPDELFQFTEQASKNPTFYADLKNPQSLDKYQYAYNNPLRWVDPDGHEPEPPQDPVVPVPVAPGLPPIPLTIPNPSGSKGPNDATIIEGVQCGLDTVCDYTGITTLADWLRRKFGPTPPPPPPGPAPPSQSSPTSSTSTPPYPFVSQPMLPPVETRTREALNRIVGQLQTATSHIEKVMSSDPNDPNRNHWKTEIKAALDKAERLSKRLKNSPKLQGRIRTIIDTLRRMIESY